MADLARTSVASPYTPKERISVLASAMVGFGLDAFDLMMITFVLVALSKDFGVTPVALGGVIAIQLVASMLGGIVFGRLADLYGRRNMLVLTIIVYSLGGIGSALSWNIASLMVFRFIAGLGLGGEWGVGTAIFNEVWTDTRRRGLGSGLIQGSYNIGVLLASVVAQWALGTFGDANGWRIAMAFTAAPIIAGVVIRRVVPESKVWAEYDALRRAGQLPPEKQRASAAGWELFKPPTLRFTITTVLMVAGYMFAFYSVSSFWPSMMTTVFQAGAAVAAVTVVASFAGAIGQVIAGHLGDIVGRKASMLGFLAIEIAGFVLIWLLAASQAAAYTGNIWSWSPLYAYVIWWIGVSNASLFGVWFSEIFPTDLRSLGVSFAYMIGRGTSAISPVLVPLLAPSVGLATAMLIGIPAILLTFLLGWTLPETLGRRLHAVEVASGEGVKAITVEEERLASVPAAATSASSVSGES